MTGDDSDFGLAFDEDDFDSESFRCSRSRGREILYLKFHSILSETDGAWFIRFPMKDDLTNDDHWFPKSQCDIPVPGQQIIEVPRWLVEEKEVEEYEVTR